MGNKAGRPLKFKDAKALQKKIEGFFSLCARTKEIPLIEGLACYLDCSVPTLRHYTSKPDIQKIIDKAKLLIANGLLQRGLANKANAQLVSMIAKKHYDYSEDVNVRHGDIEGEEGVTVNHQFKDPLEVKLTDGQHYQRMLNGGK